MLITVEQKSLITGSYAAKPKNPVRVFTKPPTSALGIPPPDETIPVLTARYDKTDVEKIENRHFK